MSENWKPGDVAMVSALNKPEPYRAYYDGKTWREHGANAFCVDAPATYGRLVVIDPEDREARERLADALIDGMCKADHGWDKARAYEVRSHMQAALREIANPTPPKPEVFRHYVVSGDGGLKRAHCGKVWRLNAEANVTVMGDCPECVALVKSGWSA